MRLDDRDKNETGDRKDFFTLLCADSRIRVGHPPIFPQTQPKLTKPIAKRRGDFVGEGAYFS
jgi:hypothetical protein